VGPTTMHALMEAVGVVDAHLVGCHRRGCSGLWPDDRDLVRFHPHLPGRQRVRMEPHRGFNPRTGPATDPLSGSLSGRACGARCHHGRMSSPAVDVVVVGAGLAGLVCALELERAHLTVTVLEAGDEVGGRIRTDEVDGYRCDRGFQLLNPSYPAVREMVDGVKHWSCASSPRASPLPTQRRQGRRAKGRRGPCPCPEVSGCDAAQRLSATGRAGASGCLGGTGAGQCREDPRRLRRAAEPLARPAGVTGRVRRASGTRSSPACSPRTPEPRPPGSPGS
jgi:hypothetical protein